MPHPSRIPKKRHIHRAHRTLPGLPRPTETEADRLKLPVATHLHIRQLGQHRLKSSQIHLRLTVSPAQRLTYLQRIRSILLAIITFHPASEFQKRAIHAFKRPEIRVREPMSEHPPNPTRRLHKHHARSVPSRCHCRCDPGGRRSVNQNVELLRP